MKFSPSLLRGTLIKRYKRFFADVELEDGTIVTAHCPNTGAMSGCAEPGYTVFLSESTNPKRKLKYTWELAQTFDGHFIGINTHNANKLVAEALDNKVLKEFSDITRWKAEVTPPTANSRFDFALERENTQHQGIIEYMEVKSVTLAENSKGFFPDAVTQRGAKHCLELARLAESGIKTSLLFCVQHTAIESVQVAEYIDPTYAESVKKAADAGVSLLAASCIIDEQKILLNQTLPLIL
ncbi:DNA/RNA nuclease SfsA [Alteromonas mediterranea]|uniref:Sugar fermentation stimulation protein homolog n=1 Tax=Alteromonas mediterranea (strain DSM 17117 / CIP 110805 / LMG 28347 / Deep ecotype) TaxID=1774373 RepID=SFSA_ALTMD|nr:DNA/RNA nuclease SfsA [Alteromonas mediterranea]B4RYN2.1 RecName: Full=Sugar fermentation stimulation protein homolog [Alteromonas mediterranea DE]AEA99807.1 XRE family transcriptional regulator [Alteromonas mediterranea DE]CAH1189317.1 Sugar fermentation stimulation protein A [Alteromonas mediterranea]